ncbi:MAG: hypothetical protein RLZ28_446 [Actinomycetota bacterium]
MDSTEQFEETVPTEHTTRLIREPDGRNRNVFTRWFLKSEGTEASRYHGGQSWWAVMCLTGVDYFSTLGYQPAIAALAAGFLSPIATLILVALTLFGALPVYRKVASGSYKGEGSIHLLEKLLPWWLGKLFVLVMLGFAATDFMITITLSAADASAHIVQNPFVAEHMSGANLIITISLIAILSIVFLIGFKEAIGLAVGLVAVYLTLNAVVVINSTVLIVEGHSTLSFEGWWQKLLQEHGNPMQMIFIALIVFPKLALGLSGFETGVAVMPQIRGSANDPVGPPITRIKGAHRLLTTAAVIMSVFLISSSFVTTFLIPQDLFHEGGAASGRALAFLAHENLGNVFGTIYDMSTILILWFAGASALAGLLNLVPRFLPRYGMAPQWAALSRPLIMVYTAIAIVVTIIFNANVEAQAGAYATGVLVLITSAAFAATLLARRKQKYRAMVGFGFITAVFVYTTIQNIIERPDGVRIASVFIAAIVVVSIISRIRRSFELRARTVHFDDRAHAFLGEESSEFDIISLVAHEPHGGGEDEYRAKARDERKFNHIPSNSSVIFLEIDVKDSSDFLEDINVVGESKFGFRVLRVNSSSIPNALAAVALAIRDEYGIVPDIYFEWNDGNPISNMLKFLSTGGGEIAVTTREVLRQAEPSARRRPRIHVS